MKALFELTGRYKLEKVFCFLQKFLFLLSLDIGEC
jgi:hypothetical protein